MLKVNHCTLWQTWKVRLTAFPMLVSMTTSRRWSLSFSSRKLLVRTCQLRVQTVELSDPFSSISWRMRTSTPMYFSCFLTPSSPWYLTSLSLPSWSVHAIQKSMMPGWFWLGARVQVALVGGAPTSYLLSSVSMRHVPRKRCAIAYQCLLQLWLRYVNSWHNIRSHAWLMLILNAFSGLIVSPFRLLSFICRISFRSYIFCRACITRCPFAICSVVFSGGGASASGVSPLLRGRPMLRAVIMCFLRMWLTTISKGRPFGQGYFSRISGIWLLEWQFSWPCLPWARKALLWGGLTTLWPSFASFPSLISLLASSLFFLSRNSLLVWLLAPFLLRRSFSPMTVLKKATISSFCPSSFWIIDRNSPNSIFPDLSSSTESMRALISSRVSKRPTEKSSSSSSSMPMEPVRFSSRELKYCFISLRSSLSKSMRYFLPLRMSHRRCSYCLRQCSWSRTSPRPRPPAASSPVRSLCDRISSRMRECWMSAVSSPRRDCLLIEESFSIIVQGGMGVQFDEGHAGGLHLPPQGVGPRRQGSRQDLAYPLLSARHGTRTRSPPSRRRPLLLLQAAGLPVTASIGTGPVRPCHPLRVSLPHLGPRAVLLLPGRLRQLHRAEVLREHGRPDLRLPRRGIVGVPEADGLRQSAAVGDFEQAVAIPGLQPLPRARARPRGAGARAGPQGVHLPASAARRRRWGPQAIRDHSRAVDVQDQGRHPRQRGHARPGQQPHPQGQAQRRPAEPAQVQSLLLRRGT